MDSLREKRAEAVFLLTSKEKNFEYAYQAFQHHAHNFVLEPVPREVLLKTLEEVIEKKRIAHEMKSDRKHCPLYEGY